MFGLGWAGYGKQKQKRTRTRQGGGAQKEIIGTPLQDDDVGLKLARPERFVHYGRRYVSQLYAIHLLVLFLV